MPRIRTIKPSFFRHGGLQDLERQYPGEYIMLVFAGLWTLCDNKGRFEYNPRQIKLDILPFLDFDIIRTIELLQQNNQLRLYKVDGHWYGIIPTFLEHQRITGKEAGPDGDKYPPPPDDINCADINKEGNNGETTGKHPVAQEMEGKWKEEMEMEMEGISKNTPPLLEKVSKKQKLKNAITAPVDHLFSESEFFDFEKFEAEFKGTDYENCDLKYYHGRVANWSKGSGKKRKDWIATARNFMLGDAGENKLKLKNGNHIKPGSTKTISAETDYSKRL